MESRFDKLADQVAAIPGVRGLWLLDAAGQVVARRANVADLRYGVDGLINVVRSAHNVGASGSPVWFAAQTEDLQILVRWLDQHALVAVCAATTNLAMVRVGISGFNLRANYPSLPPMMLDDLPELTPTPYPHSGLDLQPSKPRNLPPTASPSEEERLQRTLVDVLGPYATILLRRERERLQIGVVPTRDQFTALVDACAVHIDNAADRTRFLVRVLRRK